MGTHESPYRSQIDILAERSDQMCRDVAEIKTLVREQNGRVRTLELWQASVRGVTQTLRVAWLIAGGVIAAAVIEIARSFQ